MATITNGKYYRFRAFADLKYLNIHTDNALVNGKNVCTYDLVSNDLAQVWKVENHSGLGYTHSMMKSAKNTSFALDHWRGTDNPDNADIYTIGTSLIDLKDQWVEFEPVNGTWYRIKLKYPTIYGTYLYLTVDTSTNPHNVKWTAFTGYSNQWWYREEVDYVVGLRPFDLDISGDNYMSNDNPFYAAGASSQCTWYAWGRMKEVTGKSILFSATSGRHAKNWPNLVTNCSISTTPVEKSVAVWDNGGAYGHVGFIEKIDGNNIYITEANWPQDDDISADDGVVKQFTLSSIQARGFSGNYIIQGYLY